MSLSKYYNQKFGRRALIRTLGVGAAAPFIPVLEADAQGNGKPMQRCMIVTSPNGVEDTLPRGDETNFEFRDTLKPFNKYKGDVTCIGGIDFKTYTTRKIDNGHTEPVSQLLTGAYGIKPKGSSKNNWTSSGVSIDQFLAKRLMDDPETRTKFGSIIAGVETTNWASKIIYAQPGKPIPPETKPQNLHARMFDGVTPGSSAPTVPDPGILRKLEDERSVLDSVLADLNKIMSKVSADDRYKIEAHLESIREIEGRLVFTPPPGNGGGGSSCSIPNLKSTSGDAEDRYRKTGENMMDIIAHSFACDQTRIASLQWSNGTSKHKFPSKGVNKEHHELTHTDKKGNTGNRIKVSQWYAERILYLVEKLKSMPEGGGSVFDNTTIIWTSEHAGGGGHGRTNIPFTIFGNMGGTIQTGRYLDFRNNGGRANADAFLTIAHAMGFSDVKTFGEAKLSQGVLSGLLV